MMLPLQTFSDTSHQKAKRDSGINNSKAIQIADYNNLNSRFKDLSGKNF